jgi:sulfur-carrier protein adenylyltransferase/sulfurtransferase
MNPIITNRTALTAEEIKRYSRHLILPEVGVEGQERLKAAKVLLVGSGGLGSPAALYLAAAGIGTLGMLDFDVVDFTNLQRQILHFTSNVGQPKLCSAQEKLTAINPGIHFIPHETRLTVTNALDILKKYDLVVDGTDNFPTRYLVNDACALLKKPNVYGSIYRFDGMASVFAPHLGSPCYRCWYPEPPELGQVPSCAEAGVLGVLPGIIGTIQATEALKLILGQGTPLMGRLLRFNALTMSFKEHRIPRDPNCPLCGTNPTIAQLQEITMTCSPGSDDITVEELKIMRDRQDEFVLVDVRNPDEFVISEIQGSTKLPLHELPDRHAELPKDKLIVLHCKMGGRSARALQFLRAQGFTKLKNLAGGINAWAERIEPHLPQY